MELPQRKRNRLDKFDYCSPGYYFITICAKGRKNLFWASSELQNDRPVLTPAGQAVLQCIQSISACYPSVRVDQFNIMPNHVHLILEIHQPNCTSIPVIIGEMKCSASRLAGFSVWQKGYHDHVIRNDLDYQRIWAYVTNNHWKWREDCYFIPDCSSHP